MIRKSALHKASICGTRCSGVLIKLETAYKKSRGVLETRPVRCKKETCWLLCGALGKTRRAQRARYHPCKSPRSLVELTCAGVSRFGGIVAEVNATDVVDDVAAKIVEAVNARIEVYLAFIYSPLSNLSALHLACCGILLV